MKAIVLAGGLGTRLASVTTTMPKPMAPVGRRPFLEYLLDYLIEQGTRAAILAVSYKWDVIHAHFGRSYRDMPLHYSVEDQPLGTGGAIRQALDHSGEDEAVVLNGDTLFRVDLGALTEAHRKNGGSLTIALKHSAECGRFGRVKVAEDGVISEFLEKSSGGSGWINGGVYLLHRRLLTECPMPARFSFEHDLVEPNIDRIRPLAFKSEAYFIDMGVPEDYQRAQRQLGNE